MVPRKASHLRPTLNPFALIIVRPPRGARASRPQKVSGASHNKELKISFRRDAPQAMLEVKTFICNPLQENTYIVSDETKDCVIIDCGAFFEYEKEAIIKHITDNHLVVKHLLCTHGHFDHVMGNRALCEHLQIKPEYSQLDEPLMGHTPQNIAMFLGVNTYEEMPLAENYIDGSSLIVFGNHTFKVLETPGHTHGSLTFYCEEEKIAFTGDTLFKMSIGRTDFEESSAEEMQHSLLHLLATLPDDTVCYTGHGPSTTMGYERHTNPFLQ